MPVELSHLYVLPWRSLKGFSRKAEESNVVKGKEDLILIDVSLRYNDAHNVGKIRLEA